MEAMNMSFSDPVDLENILNNLAEPTKIPSTTIKMEDLEASSSQDPTALTSQPETSSLASASADSKSQPKKRKSWGQELPEPKTNLPPRKRAKTADEKEQRRIERVKRNRLAAHNSRERKRQEVDELQKQLDMHKAEIHHLQSRVQQQSQALQYYQSKYPGVLPAPYMMAFQPQAPEFMSQNPLLQQTSMDYQHSIVSNSSPSTSPGLPPSMTDSPDSLLKTLDSPATSGSQPATPPTEMHSLFTSTTAPNPCKKVDQTQHSAVMLSYGLPRQSTFPMGSVSTPHLTTLLSTFLAIFNLTISSLQLTISNCLEQALMIYSQMLPTLSLSTPLPCSLLTLVQTFMRLASSQPPMISSRTCTLLAQAHTLFATSPAPLLSSTNSLRLDELSIERTVGHRPLDESLREADVGWRRRSRTIGRSGEGWIGRTRWIDVGGA